MFCLQKLESAVFQPQGNPYLAADMKYKSLFKIGMASTDAESKENKRVLRVNGGDADTDAQMGKCPFICVWCLRHFHLRIFSLHKIASASMFASKPVSECPSFMSVCPCLSSSQSVTQFVCLCLSGLSFKTCFPLIFKDWTVFVLSSPADKFVYIHAAKI